MAKSPPPGRGLGGSVIGLSGQFSINETHVQHEPVCHPSETSEVVILLSIASIGCVTNLLLMLLVIVKKPLKRYHKSWSQGLLLHQGLVDLGRALLLVPLAISVMMCQRFSRCSIIDTAFLLLVSVSTVNMLTCLINDAPIFPEHEQLGRVLGSSQLQPREIFWMETMQTNQLQAGDSPYCIIFGIFIIWFASLTINLGPTFLSGALGSGTDSGGHLDVCPMVYRPVRHYVLNLLWICVNLMCVGLMAIHLRKLYKDIVKSNLEAVRVASLVTTMMTVQTDREQEDQRSFYNYVERLESEGVSRVKMFVVILMAYLLFWGPLYTVTLIQPGLEEQSLSYEISLHIAFSHCFVNPILFMVYSRGHSEESDETDNEDSANSESASGCCVSRLCCCCCRCCCCRHDDGQRSSPSRATPSPVATYVMPHNSLGHDLIDSHEPTPVPPMPFYDYGLDPGVVVDTVLPYACNSTKFNTNSRLETTI